MKQLILFLLLLPGFAVAQSDAEKVRAMQRQAEAMQRQTDSLMAVVQHQEKEMLSARTGLTLLIRDFETTKNLTAEEIANLRKENEVLREIMKNYVKQIDELNTLNLQLERSLYDCTSRSPAPEKEN